MEDELPYKLILILAEPFSLYALSMLCHVDVLTLRRNAVRL